MNRDDSRSARRGESSARDIHNPQGVRVQKVLARAGLGSRRACEDLIAEGRVVVDGVVVRELGTRVDPATQRIEVDGEPLQTDSTTITVALNKPAGVVSTMAKNQDRPTLAEFVAHRPERLFHVGRLDAESEGLILLTNDGELARRLTHPSFEVPKTYVVTVEGRLTRTARTELLDGVVLEDGPAYADSVRILDATPVATALELRLHSGRNRVVRRMLAQVDLPVTRLVRTAVGPIKLGDLKPGRTRVLGRAEVSALMATLGM
ncbi:MAG: rRNA pseudouridine synthase [Bifidobacteriaceae bacterium]|jgi:23S rRNA pseudouridine2605 synthase|nr:rRNA pseudouridine synthase [Bifidobacteriaceae bacterium]